MVAVNKILMTSPDGNTNRYVQPTTIDFIGEMSEPSGFTMLFEVDWDVFEDEEDVTNVCQVNSLVEWTRGSQTRTFFVLSRVLIEGEEGKLSINVACVDPLAKLEKTDASIDGDPLFTRASPPLTISERILTEIDADMGDVKWRFYPLRGTDAWLPINLSNKSTLRDDITIDANTIVLSNDHEGIPPIGYVQIDNEWIQYDGYDFGELMVDREYRIKHCTRGALGSDAATHDADAIVCQRISQKIHPAQAIIVEGKLTIGGEWEAMAADTFTAQIQEGSIDFNYDVKEYREAGEIKWSQFRASYAVFDEDHEDTVKLSNILSGVLKETFENGGPNVLEANIDLTGLDKIRLTRVRVTKPTYTIAFMRNLLDEVGLMKGADEDMIGLWFNHTDYKITCKALSQEDTPDYVFNHMTHQEREISLEDLYGMVRVEYEVGHNENLATHNRMIHPAVGETLGSNNELITNIVQSNNLYSNFPDTWLKDMYSVVNPLGWDNVFTPKLLDAQADTGWGLRFANNPGTGIYALWCYFSFPASSYTIDTIKVICDFRQNSDETNPISFKVMGVKDFDINTPSDSTGIVHISGNLVKMFAKGKNTEGFPVVKMEAKDVGMDLEGIVLVWDGATKGKGNERFCLVREIQVYGHRTKTVLVALTDDPTKRSEFMYAPLAYAKLFDDKLGQPRIDHMKIGGSTNNAAISLGRLRLLQTLVYDQTRLYITNQEFTDIPELGKTVKTEDGFTGIVLSEKYSYGESGETLALRLLDFHAGLIE